MKFHEKAMDSLVAKDAYLFFVFKDLARRNNTMSKKDILEIVFNSYMESSDEYSTAYHEEIKKH